MSPGGAYECGHCEQINIGPETRNQLAVDQANREDTCINAWIRGKEKGNLITKTQRQEYEIHHQLNPERILSQDLLS